MCGLIMAASFKNKPVNIQVIEQFRKQALRGRQGFGLLDDRGHLIRKTKENDMLKWLRSYKSTEILFHHRLPTSTENVKNACHPFSTQDHFKTNYILIHNGHISNADTLKFDHEKLGIEYYSVQKDGKFNDSEALLWDVALHLEGKKDLEAYGGIAFICLAIKGDERKLYFARNTNPLYMKITKKRLFLASESGLADHQIETDTLYTFDYTTKKLETSPLEIKSYYTYTGRHTREHGWSKDQFEDEEDKNTLRLPGTVIRPKVKSKKEKEDEEIQKKIAEDMTKEELVYEEDELIYDETVYDDVYDISLVTERVTLLKKLYAKYMRENQGYYWACLVQMRNDIKDYEALRYEATSQEELSDLTNKASLVRSLKDMMIVDPQYKSFNSRHPSYKNKPKTILDMETA